MDIGGNALVIGGGEPLIFTHMIRPEIPNITLTGSGIGRACAVLLAKEGASGLVVADLAIDAARDTIAECHTVATNTQFRSKGVLVDVTREDSVRSLFGETVSAFGRIDYCVNSAGVSERSACFDVKLADSRVTRQIGVREAADIATLSLAEFQRFLDINTTGMFLVTKEASIAMRAQEERPISLSTPGRGTTRGAIVNLGSASSLIASPGVLAYTAAKHAALGLTKNSGEHLADSRVYYTC